MLTFWYSKFLIFWAFFSSTGLLLKYRPTMPLFCTEAFRDIGRANLPIWWCCHYSQNIWHLHWHYEKQSYQQGLWMFSIYEFRESRNSIETCIRCDSIKPWLCQKEQSILNICCKHSILHDLMVSTIQKPRQSNVKCHPKRYFTIISVQENMWILCDVDIQPFFYESQFIG